MIKTRSCKVKDRQGEFHTWESISRIVPPSPMVGGHGDGVVSQMFALVEFEDGHIERCEPYDIIFIDKTTLPKREETTLPPPCFEQEKTQCPFCDGENKNATIFKMKRIKNFSYIAAVVGLKRKKAIQPKQKP